MQVRTLLLSNGSDLATVDNLTIEDAKALYVSLQTGLWGPFGEAHMAYSNYCSMHAQKETTVAVAIGKKFTPTPPKTFMQMFPHMEDYMTLGEAEVRKATQHKHELAKKAMLAIPADGAPSWLKEAVKQ